MKRFIALLIFIGILAAASGQSEEASPSPPTVATVEAAFEDFPITFRTTETFTCDPDLETFMRTTRPPIFSTNPCVVRAQPAFVIERRPVVTECCSVVHQFAYVVPQLQRIAVFRVPCVEICCRVCDRLSSCLSWSYRYSSKRCVLNRSSAIPFYSIEAAGNNK
eukprot:g3759.t1